MLQPQQIDQMLQLQAEMNLKVHPDWLQQHYPFLRAVVIEGAEAIEHHGWKWWKQQHCDLEQLQMELVDIWHFILSESLQRSQGDRAQAQTLLLQGLSEQQLGFDGQHYCLPELSLLNKLELLIGLAAAGRFSVGLFAGLLNDAQLDWDGLYRQYVSKNVLNFFRQDNGYQQGTYRKNWDGREDNEHLVELMAALDCESDSFREDLYEALHQRYARSR